MTVASDTIEREILIQARADVVWGVITEPAQISRWFTDEAEVEALAGCAGTLIWKAGGRAGSGEGGLIAPILVVDAEPYRRFSFRWCHPEGASPDEGNSALVEFSLTEEADRTRLRVVESGIDAVTYDDESRTRYRGSHERGWEKHLGELLDYLASQPLSGAR